MTLVHNNHTEHYTACSKINDSLYVNLVDSLLCTVINQARCLFIIQAGRTALAWAAHRGHKQIMDMLLEAGANHDIQDKVTELVCAC